MDIATGFGDAAGPDGVSDTGGPEGFLTFGLSCTDGEGFFGVLAVVDVAEIGLDFAGEKELV